jgi:hypothetical protein
LISQSRGLGDVYKRQPLKSTYFLRAIPTAAAKEIFSELMDLV